MGAAKGKGAKVKVKEGDIPHCSAQLLWDVTFTFQDDVPYQVMQLAQEQKEAP